MKPKLSVALVHHPILDRAKNVIATNITNFDIHDIARACRVYDVERYYIVHPMQEQLMFVSRVLDHWRVGTGSKLNPMRRTALTMVHPIESLEAALADWNKPEALVLSTSAKDKDSDGRETMTFRGVREAVASRDVMLVFGTGFGLADQALDQCHANIEPIRGAGDEDYRHLSVRSAVSIVLDRVRGEW